MRIFFVREDGKKISKAAKFLSKLNGVSASNISIFTSETKGAIDSAIVIRDAIGLRKINKRSWLNYYGSYSDKMKCPLIMRKICTMVIKGKKTRRIIFITHLDEIKETLKWATEKKYRMFLDGEIQNGSIISVSMNEEEKIVEKVFPLVYNFQ